MRIALIAPKFPPLCCGVGDYAIGLAQALRAQGHSVIAITRPASGARAPEIRVVETPLKGWGDVGSLLRILNEERIDRVQIEYSGYGWSRWGFAFWLNALVIALRLRGTPVSLGLHETYLRFADHPRLAAISVLQRIHILLLASSVGAVYLNMPERVRNMRRLLPWHRAGIHYRPNSSTIPVSPVNEHARRQLRLAHGANPGDCVVATFGMFQRGKNLEALLEAVASAKSSRTLRLWLLGDSAGASLRDMDALRERIHVLRIDHQVYWSGYLTPAEVSAHLQAADIFMLPQPDGHLTRSSAFMAAAAHARPVIAVRNAKNQAEFTPGEDVWLVKKSDAAELTAALEALEREPELAARLGTNLGRLYRDKFDWTVTTGARGDAEASHASTLDSPRSPQTATKS
ncbi:MAG: glycosyltransferase family 4 protein [Acidipila sp.]|nr:glycosyltransferase family 4 protein [Acidipila sp.]